MFTLWAASHGYKHREKYCNGLQDETVLVPRCKCWLGAFVSNFSKDVERVFSFPSDGIDNLPCFTVYQLCGSVPVIWL